MPRLSLVLLILLFSLDASALSAKISGWKETQNLTEAEAARLVEKAIDYELAVDQDGEMCGVEDVWALTREPGPQASTRPGVESFAVTAYAEGPHGGCSGTRNYDCRMVFQRPQGTSEWRVEFTECEPVSVGFED